MLFIINFSAPNLENDRQRTEGYRSDLGGTGEEKRSNEKITQIMRPSMIEPLLSECPLYQLVLEHAKDLLGDDMEL
ncbi:MAG: hypothetical protein V3V00_09360, partial [Saprospiraceae bacterium]